MSKTHSSCYFFSRRLWSLALLIFFFTSNVQALTPSPSSTPAPLQRGSPVNIGLTYSKFTNDSSRSRLYFIGPVDRNVVTPMLHIVDTKSNAQIGQIPLGSPLLKCTPQIEACHLTFESIDFSPDGKYVAISELAKSYYPYPQKAANDVVVFDLQQGTSTRILNYTTDNIGIAAPVVRFNSDSNLIFYDYSHFSFYTISSGAIQPILGLGGIGNIEVSSARDRLFGIGSFLGSGVDVLDLSPISLELRRGYHGFGVMTSFAEIRDEKRILFFERYPTSNLVLFDLQSSKVAQKIPLPGIAYFYSVAATPFGLVATDSSDGTSPLIEYISVGGSLRQIAKTTTNFGSVSQLSYTTDGSKIFMRTSGRVAGLPANEVLSVGYK